MGKILINSDLYDKNNKLVECGLSLQSKTELYYLFRFYQKASIFINDLVVKYKDKKTGCDLPHPVFYITY